MQKFIGNLPLWQKFALIGLISLSALVPPCWLVAKNSVSDLGAANDELAGIAPARAVIALIHDTQTHRGLAVRAFNGDAAAAATRAALQADIAKAVASARAVVAGMGNAKVDERFDAYAKDWQAISAGIDGKSLTPPQSFARHTEAVTALLAVLESITDESGLILDPESVTYHLMFPSLVTLPRLTETLAQARGRGANVIGNGEGAAADKLTLGALLGTAGDQLATAHKELDKSIGGDASLVQPITQPPNSAVALAEGAITLAEAHVIRPAQPDITAKAYFDEVTRSNDAQFALIGTAAGRLEAMLVERSYAKRNDLIVVSTMVGMFVLLTLVVIVNVTRSVSRSVKAAVDAARALAAGDLSHPMAITTRDEFGQLLGALRDSMDHLAALVGGIQRASDSVSIAAVQIANGNLDLSNRTEQQASNLQQTAASMSALNTTLRRSAETAHDAASMAQTASAVATEGGQAVSRVVATMDEITTNSSKIAEITNVIDLIAFQTNILALNAAVEAARAGEQGRGFAVVAGEVRSLAGRASNAAKEIKSLIAASVEKVRIGSTQVDEAGRTMTQIVSEVSRVSQMIATISDATSQQTTGLDQVNDAVGALDRMTQQNAALVEESAAAAESLRHQAGQLVGAVSTFRTTGGHAAV